MKKTLISLPSLPPPPPPPPFYSPTTNHVDEGEQEVEIIREKRMSRPVAVSGSPQEKKSVVKKKLERNPSVDINESADAFIKKFRQQLLLQRLESIEKYEQMLRRGT